jgi:hypothetical protein
MSAGDVERLLSEFIREQRERGEADPRRYLVEVEGAERRELRALIDAYLLRAPHRSWDRQGFAGSRAESIAADLEGMYLGTGEPVVALRGLRARAELKRSQVARRLAELLGVSNREEKVAYYYHRMESGLLPPRGISARVLESLASIIGSTAEEIRQALGATPEPPASPGPVMARSSVPDPEYAGPESAAAPDEEAIDEVEDVDFDEVDRLFVAGEDA